jgi:hypothetical protein
VGEQDTVTAVIVGPGGVTVMTMVPVFDVSWVEVAVTVTVVGVVTAGGVNRPAVLIVPAVVFQVTLLLKLPVPVTVATHWEVVPDCKFVSEQLTTTAVMVPEPPLLHDIIKTMPATTAKNANLRT